MDDAEIFGPYRLIELIGRGGTGEVWRAFDIRWDRTVALKRLAGPEARDHVFRERFRNEAQLTARLSSPHVIPIHDFGEIDGRPYVDMRLVAGGDLAAAIRRSRRGLGRERAAGLVAQIASALDCAHEIGMVHRDVKPSNVLLDGGDVDFAYLVDFGIARLATEAGNRLTGSGVTLGTPAYMAPELLTGSEPASAASDVYALGCVLYELLLGRRAFTGTEPMVLVHQHVSGHVPVPSRHDRSLAAFDPVLRRALAKEPVGRYPTAGALARAATAAAAAPPPASGPRAVAARAARAVAARLGRLLRPLRDAVASRRGRP